MTEISRRQFLKGAAKVAVAGFAAATGVDGIFNQIGQNNYETYRRGGPRKEWKIDPHAKIAIVRQGTYAIAGGDVFLLTPYAESCVIVVLSVPKFERVVKGHLDLFTNPYAAVHLMIKDLGLPDRQEGQIETRLIGGTEGWSEKLVEGLLKALRSRGKIELVECDLFTPRPVSVITHPRTGKTYNFSQWPKPADTRAYFKAIKDGPSPISGQIVGVQLRELPLIEGLRVSS